MDMEKLLAGLFDFQRFEREPALERVLQDTEARYFSQELSEDALRMISAAGDPILQAPDLTKRDEPL